MRTKAVSLHQTCNQACTFCTLRRPHDDPAQVAHDAVKARIAETIGDGVEELVLTGGEPTMRRDLVVLVRHARACGARTIVLETNATLLDVKRVAALRDAGVDRVRVHVPALGPALARITRDETAEPALDRGLRALAAAGLPIDVAIPIVRGNLDQVAAIPAGLVARLGDATRLGTLRVHVPTEAADEGDLVPYDRAAAAILALTEAARAEGLETKLAPDAAPPPCVFPAARRPSELYALSGRARASADHVRVAACQSCRAADACPGVLRSYLDRFGAPKVTPVRDERARRRLALISTTAEQIARELVQPGGRPRSEGDPEERIVRVNFHCNQACDFCFVSTHLPAPPVDRVRRAIEQALEDGVRIVLSGGEPTMNPRLAEHLALATRSPWPVELQTNAVRLADASLARALVDAGLRLAFVSLHGATAETSDTVTRAPGTFVKTLRGVDNLQALGVELRLNFVICRTNAAELPAVVDLVAERWPGASLTVSFVAHSTDVVPRDRNLLPRYSDVVPFVAQALARAAARGVTVVGFESMCGLPLCLVPGPPDEHLALPKLDPAAADEELEKPPVCDGCALSTRCFGVRRGYLELHGDDELRPVPARSDRAVR